ncbi:MAG: alanine--glyoxylate aminotransferase family protein [Archaeoglobi archaeon]|nr:alanine--glyoxylate aminotransferase family protein [Candidatus Mnemosynella bozhongmuii]
MREGKETLMIPGPVELDPRVLRAMAKPMIAHRGEEFGKILEECREILGEILNTSNDVLIISGSGTSGMEAAISNFIGKGDKIAVIENGKFGERFAEISRRYGDLIHIKYEWGEPVELGDVEDALRKGATAIAMVHNETSVGLLNPAEKVGELAEEYGALFILDVITTIGGDLTKIDEWNVDVAVGGTQKCLGAPPGLSVVSVSEDAWRRIKETRPYYLDLLEYRKSAEKRETPYTPAVPLFFALREALEIIMEEGMEKRIERHRRQAKAIREAVLELGLELFPRTNEVTNYSNTVTAIKMPEGVEDRELRGKIRELGYRIAGGQGRLKGRIFRISNMGNFTTKDIIGVISALELTLRDMKLIEEIGRGIERAYEVLKGA